MSLEVMLGHSRLLYLERIGPGPSLWLAFRQVTARASHLFRTGVSSGYRTCLAPVFHSIAVSLDRIGPPPPPVGSLACSLFVFLSGAQDAGSLGRVRKRYGAPRSIDGLSPGDNG